MDAFIGTFHIDWKIIAAQAVNFFVVLVILHFLVLKPMRKLMAEREGTISRGVSDAKTNAELLENTKAEYAKVISDAHAEAHTIFQEGKKEAEAKKAEMLEKAHEEVASMVANGKKALEAEKTKMVDEAKKEIVSLVVRATEKLLGDNADASFDNKVAEKMEKKK